MSGGPDAALSAAEAGGPASTATAAKAGPAPASQHSQRPGRFKIVARMILAMKRFEAALNPTYTYGKRPDTPPHPGAVAGGTPPPAAVPRGPPGGADWVPASAAGSPPPEVHAARKGALPTYVHHGHRASLLSARLPSVGDVTAAGAGADADK